MDIVSLAKELERLKQTSVDIVAASKNIHAKAADELKLGIDGYGVYPLSKLGSLQLADKTGIPRKYYEAMLAEGLIDLTAQNVNAWLEKSGDRRLVRIADGHIRALLSDRYRVLDNYDLAMLTMDRARDHGATVQECQLTESRMYVKLVVPNYKEEIAKGDDVVPGLVVSNSEVGEGAFRVEPFLFRLVCSNGLIGADSLYKVHISGHRLELGQLDIFKDDTKRAMDQALWEQVRDIIDATFNRDILRILVAQLKASKEVPIEKPQERIDVTARDLSLSDKAKLDLLRYFAKEGDTLFGLVNGITRLARDFKDYDEQVRVERYAGEVLRVAPEAK